MYQIKEISVLIVLSVALSSCSKIQMSEIPDANAGLGTAANSGNTPTGFNDNGYNPEPGSGGSTTNPPVGTVNNHCNSTNKQVRNIDFFFPKPDKTCEWSANGNLAKKNEYFQARIEQEQILDLGANTVLCDIDFDFEEQPFLYDDHVLLTFNNAVIASSFNFDEKFSLVNGLLRYDWSKMAGMYWEKSKEGTFCPPGASCYWPVTDTNGKIMIDYPAGVFKTIMAENLSRYQHSVKFISIGDNDDWDCEHSDLRFTMKVTYVNK